LITKTRQTANVTDRKGALQAFSLHSSRLSKVQKILLEGVYTGKPFADEVKRILNAGVDVAKRNELHTFAVIPKRINVFFISLNAFDSGFDVH
jgi:hypothetical protein